MAKKTYDHLFKLLLVGDSGVGKTCVLFRFSDDLFCTSYVYTIGIDFKIKTITVNGKKIKLQIWDTAGQERFHTLTFSYYRGAKGIIMVYDITDMTSFQNISKWISQINERANHDVTKMIIGNKCDKEDERQVSKEIVEQYALERDIPFYETSAKSNYQVDYIFHRIAEIILEKCTDGIDNNNNGNNNHNISKKISPTYLSNDGMDSGNNNSFSNCCR
ncbi:hypothetical protein SNEBB_010975 [Seison nebaliae]|nr:hypothetical protein SNEBB_010975 [Seison nebaliae]